MPPMPNIAYFEIPAENVERAKKFYHGLLGWKIAPTKSMGDPARMKAMEYQDVVTGEAKEGTLNMGGMYKRQMNEQIMTYAMVQDIDKVLAKVPKLGGMLIVPKMEIPGVGLTAILQDTEGNTIGIWEPRM